MPQVELRQSGLTTVGDNFFENGAGIGDETLDGTDIARMTSDIAG
jgi:hypothetical protein